MSFFCAITPLFNALLNRIAGKAVDTGVDRLLDRRRRKRNESHLNDIRQNTEDIKEYLFDSSRAFEDSGKIKSISTELRPLIETLHVKTAHSILDNLRRTISSSDRKTLSRVDYYRSCCSKYTNRRQAIDEINLAYQEMLDYQGYDPDIVSARIYVFCLCNEAHAAKQAANKLKTIDRNSVWAWVPDLLFSEDLSKAYEELPNDINAPLVLANSCSIGNNIKSLGVDIKTYKVQIPSVLSYENIPLWTFNLSVLINLFIPEWNHSSMEYDSQPGEATKLLFEATSKLKALQQKTELNDIVSDLDLWHSISGCQIKPTDDLLEILENCACRKEFEEYRVVAYVNILIKLEHFDKAKDYLTRSIITPSVLNQRFLISLQTADPEYAVEAFIMADSSKVRFPSLLIVYALSAIKSFSEFVLPYASKLCLESDQDTYVYQQICKFYAGETPDIQYILENRYQFERPFQPFVAIILHANKYIEEGLSLIKSCLSESSIDMVSGMYIDLLEQTPTHRADLYAYLKHVREDIGVTNVRRWTQLEYNLASRLSDFARMLTTSMILYHDYPDDPHFFIGYLQALVHNNDKDALDDLVCKVHNYTFTPTQVHFVYAQLVLAGYTQLALDLLFDSCQQYPTNEELSISFFHATVNPSTAAIINKEYDEVMDGLYVHYTQNGEAKSSLIDETNRLSFLIGHKIGETIKQNDWRGTSEYYEITGIYNKYYLLSERIHKDITDNKFNAVRSIHFTDEDLKTGSIFEELPLLAGQDQDYLVRRNETLRQYKEGNMSLLAFTKDEHIVSDLYNLIFGNFKLYGFTAFDFDCLYESQKVQIESLQPVFDLSSLLLYYEIYRKFNITIGKRVIIPQILVHHLEMTLRNEVHGSPSGVYRLVAERLIPAQTDEDWLVSRIKELLMWIKDNALIENTTERLNQDQSLFKESLYMTLFYDCYSLVKQGRVLISADKALVRIFAKYIPVGDVNYLLHRNSQYPNVSIFYMETDIYGGDLDVDYVYGEYVKHSSGKTSNFMQCKENLMLCPNLFKVTLEVCERISLSPIVSSADSLIIEELMSSLFQSIGRQPSLKLLQDLIKNSASIRFKQLALQVFKIAFPIV